MLHLVQLAVEAAMYAFEGVHLEFKKLRDNNARNCKHSSLLVTSYYSASSDSMLPCRCHKSKASAHFCNPVNCFAFSPPPELTCRKPSKRAKPSAHTVTASIKKALARFPQMSVILRPGVRERLTYHPYHVTFPGRPRCHLFWQQSSHPKSIGPIKKRPGAQRSVCCKHLQFHWAASMLF